MVLKPSDRRWYGLLPLDLETSLWSRVQPRGATWSGLFSSLLFGNLYYIFSTNPTSLRRQPIHSRDSIDSRKLPEMLRETADFEMHDG